MNLHINWVKQAETENIHTKCKTFKLTDRRERKSHPVVTYCRDMWSYQPLQEGSSGANTALISLFNTHTHTHLSLRWMRTSRSKLHPLLSLFGENVWQADFCILVHCVHTMCVCWCVHVVCEGREKDTMQHDLEEYLWAGYFFYEQTLHWVTTGCVTTCNI